MHHDGVWLAFGMVQDIMGAPPHLLRCRVTLQAISNIPFQITSDVPLLAQHIFLEIGPSVYFVSTLMVRDVCLVSRLLWYQIWHGCLQHVARDHAPCSISLALSYETDQA
jgi:hypothetical protein